VWIVCLELEIQSFHKVMGPSQSPLYLFTGGSSYPHKFVTPLYEQFTFGRFFTFFTGVQFSSFDLMNQLFWKNHLSQETATTRLAATGQRSLSAPASSNEAHPPGRDLRKYMAAGQRISQRGAVLDPETGMVGMNQGSENGVWSLMVDPSAAAPAPERRMRGHAFLPDTVAEDEVLASKMRWDPAAESREAARRDAQAARWESAPSSMPSGQAPITVGKKQVAGGQGSLNLGWESTPPSPAPPAAPMATTRDAPWLRAEEAQRPSRRAVEGKDSTSSRITWQGYGVNDPVSLLYTGARASGFCLEKAQGAFRLMFLIASTPPP
jgi:hypothetical protein